MANVVGEVVHIDRFGNLVTNIQASQLPPSARITVGSTVIDRVSDHYGEVDAGGVLAIVGHRPTRSQHVDPWAVLETIELIDNELRLVVDEGTNRFAEYFTLNDVLLEREQLD